MNWDSLPWDFGTPRAEGVYYIEPTGHVRSAHIEPPHVLNVFRNAANQLVYTLTCIEGMRPITDLNVPVRHCRLVVGETDPFAVDFNALPSWVEFHAVDKSGIGFGYELQPNIATTMDRWQHEKGRIFQTRQIHIPQGFMLLWQLSLRRRNPINGANNGK